MTDEQTSEWAVKAETHEGKTFVLRKGFPSEEDAESHPVVLSLWKRVWVEEIHKKPKPPAELPPRPWKILAVPAYGGKVNFIYLTDANGRKIMSLLGRPEEKEIMAATITAAINA